jgi:leucyl aminopeptidase
MLPAVFAERAKAAATAAGLTVTVWDEKRIAKEKLGGLLAVNQGSTHPPRFLMVSYTPKAKPTGSIALVGKGITFDSGGLSIKTGAGMMTMKVDMAGGAAVVGAMTLLGVLGCTKSVTAYVPLTDNMINGDAFRPGDVFRARNGKTVEVLNTDAEGRLVLADALSLAAEAKPDAIIDIATLTGAVSAALGVGYAGIMGNDDGVAARLEAASARTGEKVWRLPLPPEYRSQLDSTVADLKNIGAGPYGGALTAGLFLAEFVDSVPWGHIDLGMSAMSETDDGLVTKGATGFGVRLLADTVVNW